MNRFSKISVHVLSATLALQVFVVVRREGVYSAKADGDVRSCILVLG